MAIILLGSCETTKDLYPSADTIIKNQMEWQKNIYFKRVEEFKKQPMDYRQIVFLGNSITEGGGEWSKRFNAYNIINRGISGDYTDGVLMRLDEIIHYRPIAIFIMIGVNEFWNDNTNKPHLTPEHIAGNILNICRKIKGGSPETKVFIQTILPVNNNQYLNVKKVDYNFLQQNHSPTVNDQINQANMILKNNEEFEVIELHSLFLNNESILDSTLSKDGIHINDNGYQIWVNKLKPLIDSLNKKNI